MEESELEEIVESDEVEEVAEAIEDADEELADVDDDMIENRFVQPVEMRGVSLEKNVEGSQENIWTRDANAREEISGSIGSERDPFKYNASNEEEEKSKYMDYSQTAEVSRIDFNKVGRDNLGPQVREAGFVHSETGNDFNKKENYIEPTRVDISQAGRGNPFESSVREAERKISDYETK